MHCAFEPKTVERYNGFTLVELVVSLGIISLLLAFAVVAVQRTRESARRLVCEQNLHQVGVAISNFESRIGYVETQYDPWEKLLPDLDKAVLADQLSNGEPSVLGSCGVDVLCCPTDGWSNADWALTSYQLNAGSQFEPLQPDGFIALEQPGSPSYGRRYWREITDGASMTVMAAERLVDRLPGYDLTMADHAVGDKVRFLRFLPQAITPVGDGRELVRACQANGTLPTLIVAPWCEFSFGTLHGFDHMQPPNHWGCWNGAESGYAIGMRSATAPASSLHPGGAIVLVCDGAVRFASEAVDGDAWRAVGSIAGHEPVELW